MCQTYKNVFFFLINMWTHIQWVSLYNLIKEGDIKYWKLSWYDMVVINFEKNPIYRSLDVD